MRKKDLMVMALATTWLDEDRHPVGPMILMAGRFPSQHRGASRNSVVVTRPQASCATTSSTPSRA